MKEGFNISPIGYAKNDVHDIRFGDWKNLVSRLVIDERYIEALEGLEEFSHLFVISWLHLPGKLLLKRHPRGRQDLPVVGIFATRSQLRPNRIGLHLGRLLERKENELLSQAWMPWTVLRLLISNPTSRSRTWSRMHGSHAGLISFMNDGSKGNGRSRIGREVMGELV